MAMIEDDCPAGKIEILDHADNAICGAVTGVPFAAAISIP